jgi:hypothetical protein
VGELEEFFLGSWSLLDCLEMNFKNDTKQMLGFFRGSPRFYELRPAAARARHRTLPAQPPEDEHEDGDGDD